MKVILCTILLIGTAMAASIVPKIVGGKPAQPHEFPYMVSLQWVSPKKTHFCGGSLLSERWVLTAGHCVHALKGKDEVVAGAHSIKRPDQYEQRRKVLRTFVHEDYSGDVGPHDVGLIEVSEPFEFNEYVHSVNLPSKDTFYPAGPATLSGWGSISNGFFPSYPDKLLKADLPVQTADFCFTNYPGTPMHESNICAGDLDGSLAACSGDSGSPLTVNNSQGKAEVYGIASWTWMPCGTPGKTGVFVNVSFYLKWLKEKMSN